MKNLEIFEDFIISGAAQFDIGVDVECVDDYGSSDKLVRGKIYKIVDMKGKFFRQLKLNWVDGFWDDSRFKLA